MCWSACPGSLLRNRSPVSEPVGARSFLLWLSLLERWLLYLVGGRVDAFEPDWGVFGNMVAAVEETRTDTYGAVKQISAKINAALCWTAMPMMSRTPF